MQEEFLHFIWKFQYFDKHNLTTTSGELINVISQGIQNHNSGPDFSFSKVKIGKIDWHGFTEIHIDSSDWNKHRHQNDKAYDKTILHVVWQDDKEVLRSDGSLMPTLELRNRVNLDLIYNYKNLLGNADAIPCATYLSSVNRLAKYAMMDFVVMKRLEKKAGFLLQLVNQNITWEEATYRLLAKNFGFKVNSESFLTLAESTPQKIIYKHADNLLQIEALLFGQAGFLDNKNGDLYFSKLKKEYDFLAHKYGIAAQKLTKHQWKFSRLRPGNFPAIRIAQFSFLCYSFKNLFSTFKEVHSYSDFSKKLKIHQSEYWQGHYSFAKKSKAKIAGLGKSSVDNVLINTVIPLKVAYGIAKDAQVSIDNAISLLENLPAENNKITRLWKDTGFAVKNAYDSQSLIELYNNFCVKRKCLTCKIGVDIVKKT